MQIKNQVSITRYIVLSILHLAGTVYYVGPTNINVLLIVFLAIFLNQACLFAAMHKLLNVPSEERDNTGIFLLFTAKLLILVAGLWYGMENFEGNKLIIIGNYIFQLIILSLSIKRLGKKN
jgi:heme/copper-type cytochrome/quinol oxidase subunit 4